MMPCVVPLPRLQPRYCSGWASLTQRSSLLPAHGSSPLWESCSSTSRFAFSHPPKHLKVLFGSCGMQGRWQFQLAIVQHPVIETWHLTMYSIYYVILCSHSSVSVQATEQAKEDVKRALTVLNQHLTTRTFLVGERISLADITVACSMIWLYKQVCLIQLK